MTRFIRTNCPRDCYDGCGIRVEIRESGPHRVLGDPDHPVSRGKLCSKCAVAYNGVWQDPTARLLMPLKRTGRKGSGSFTAIGWDEALATIASETRKTLDAAGGSAILHTHYSGTLGLIGYLFPNRFFNHLGASEVDPDTICNAAGHVAWTLLFGNSVQGFDPRTAVNARCILVWGANPSHSAPHAHEHWLPESGARIIVIDPTLTDTARAADLHLRPRPGSDAALAFCLLHCLQKNGHFDQAFIDRHTIGLAEISGAIATATPEWGELQTGIPADDIRLAAAIYGTGPSLLWCGQALQRQAQGGNIMRAIGLLPALTGNIGKPGAGFYYLNVTPLFAGIDLAGLAGARLKPIASAGGQGGKKVSHMALATRLATEEFRQLFVWNTNPVASAPAQNKLKSALVREDLFTVVIDPFMTDTAHYADIVLPAASFLEFDDITFSYFHLHIGAQRKVMEPLGESLPNAEIFRRLAAALQLDEPALYESDVDLIDQIMAQMNVGLDFAALAARGYTTVGVNTQTFWADLQFATPSGKIEIVSEQAVLMGLPRVPLPRVDEPSNQGQFRLLTPSSRFRLNDSYANDPHLETLAGPARVHMHPADATRLALKEGDRAHVSSAEGAIELAVHIDMNVLPGTALSYKGRWLSREDSGSNVNVLHSPVAADMGDSTSVHSTLVSLRLATGDP